MGNRPETTHERIARVRSGNLQSLEDADLARSIFLDYASQLVLETHPGRVAYLVAEVRHFAGIVPLCRPWLDAEVERIKRETPISIMTPLGTEWFVPKKDGKP